MYKIPAETGGDADGCSTVGGDGATRDDERRPSLCKGGSARMSFHPSLYGQSGSDLSRFPPRFDWIFPGKHLIQFC